MGKLANIVLVCKAGKLGKMLYAGWTETGLPILTTSPYDLTTEALTQAQTFTRSGFPMPTLSMRAELGVVVVEFAGAVLDLKDSSPRNLVEDSIKIWVKDSRGSTEELSLGELEVLEMIGNNMIMFQRFGSVLDTQDRQVAVPFYSFFLAGSPEAGRQDLLVLIRATNDNLGNIIDTVVFIQDVIKKLLLNDESQDPRFKKGYLQADKQAEKEIQEELKKSGGIFSFLMVPEDQPDPVETLKQMIVDFVMVSADGTSKNILADSPKQSSTPMPDKNTLDKLVRTAAKMFLFARSKIR